MQSIDTENLSEKIDMTVGERWAQLHKNLHHINQLAFPSHFKNHYNELVEQRLMQPALGKYTQHESILGII